MTPAYTQQSLETVADEIRLDLVRVCEKNAEWRDGQAGVFPDDRERNQTCAKKLRSLAVELRTSDLGEKAIRSMAGLVLSTGLPFGELLSNGRDAMGRPSGRPEHGSPRHTIAKYGWPGRDGLFGVADPAAFLETIAVAMIRDYEEGLPRPAAAAVPGQPGPGLEKDLARLVSAAERIAGSTERIARALDALQGRKLTIGLE